jgi:DNA recombination protein RmuC
VITPEVLASGLVLAVLLGMATLLAVLLRGGGVRAEGEAMRVELAVVGRAVETSQRAEAESLRAVVVSAERALAGRAEATRLEDRASLHELSTRLLREAGEQRVLMETKLREMGEQQAMRLGDIQRSVNEKLTESIEKQMHGSFQRVIDQFAQVQKAMGDVQAVTAQIGDLKRIFTNVKTRGAWGEMALRALLEDVLPHGAWEANRKLRADSDEVVEFVLVMPSRSKPSPLLAIDAKFPAEDYDRLLLASEAGDADGERTARRALEQRLRLEARRIAGKYIVQPVTVDFGIMYLPTDGLYVEAARMPGLIEGLNREHRVLVMGPSLLPALLRTIHLGALTLSIEQRAEQIQHLLGAVRTEFGRMDGVLAKLEKQAGSVSNTIGDARRRTRAMDRTLRGVTALAADQASAALQLEEAVADDDEA